MTGTRTGPESVMLQFALDLVIDTFDRYPMVYRNQNSLIVNFVMNHFNTHFIAECEVVNDPHR